MPTLAQMLAQKNQQTVASNGKSEAHQQAGPIDSDAHSESVSGDAVARNPSANQSDKLSSGDVPAQATPAPSSKPVSPGGFRLGGLKLGQPVASPGNKEGSTGPIASGVGKDAAGPVPSTGESAHGLVDGDSKAVPARTGLSLTDIAGLGSGDGEQAGLELTEIDPEESGGYLDEVPATAPVRDLPTELDKSQKSFIDSLNAIYTLHDDPDMFVDMVKKIMSEMQDNPDLALLLAPGGEDSNAMIRGLRQQAGMAQVKKQE